MNRSTNQLLSRLVAALPARKMQRKPVNRNTGKRLTANGTRGRVSTVNNQSWGRSLPAAYASHVRPRFNVVARTATAAKVSGCDLIYPIPSILDPNDDTIFAIFPANPAYWTGTRISQFAPAYQNYRPISFTVSYIPQVAVTQAGTVFMGSLWNEAAPSDNIQQSLFTSNGGCLTQCYVPCDTTIRCANNLPQNLFTVAGALHPDTCPFLFLAGVRGANVVPGYFYVTYTYEFKNPIGSAWHFNVTANTTVSAISNMALVDNMTAVLLTGSGDFGPGTQLDIERTTTGVQLFYHGSVVNLTGTTPVQVYSNYQANRDRDFTTLVSVTVGQQTTLFSEFNTSSSTMSVPASNSVIYIDNNNGAIVFYSNGSGSSAEAFIPSGVRYSLFNTAPITAAVNNSSGDVAFTLEEINGGASTTRVIPGPEFKIQF